MEALLLPLLLASATTEEVFRVSVHPSGCDSAVGTVLVYALREKLSQSALFELVPTREPGGLRLHITCVDADESGKEIAVAVATTVGNNERFMGLDASVVNSKGAPAIAQQIVATLDDRTRRFRRSPAAARE